jgi:hypothetical protein
MCTCLLTEWPQWFFFFFFLIYMVVGLSGFFSLFFLVPSCLYLFFFYLFYSQLRQVWVSYEFYLGGECAQRHIYIHSYTHIVTHTFTGSVKHAINILGRRTWTRGGAQELRQRSLAAAIPLGKTYDGWLSDGSICCHDSALGYSFFYSPR